MSKFKDSGAYKAFMSQPKVARGIEIGLALVVTYFAARGIWKFIKTRLDTAKNQKTINDLKSDISALGNRGISPSFPDSQYQGWADKIQNQFDGCDFSVPALWSYSTSGQTLADIIVQLKNDADFAKLVTAFGIRTYDQCGLWTGNFTGNLFAAVSDELT